MPGRGTSAPGWNSQPHPRTALLGTIYGAGRGVGDEDGCIQSGGKAAPRKSPKTDFSSALGNPAQPAGFPLSHRPGGCWLTETGQLMCYENRTFSLATDSGRILDLFVADKSAWALVIFSQARSVTQ